jgi:hypothetical protein
VKEKRPKAEWLRDSLADHAAYWSSLGELTPAQKRWQAVEEKLRKNLAAQATMRTDAMPAAWQLKEIRSGRWEQRQRQNMQNLLRNRARLWRLRRDGYSFDAEHRLVAPRALPRPSVRPRERRPQSRVARRAVAHSPPRRDDDEDPEPPVAPRDSRPWSGLEVCSVRMVASAAPQRSRGGDMTRLELLQDAYARCLRILEALEVGDIAFLWIALEDLTDDLRMSVERLERERRTS